MQDYRKLAVWQKAHNLTLAVYADSAAHLTAPRAWALRDQIHRAAISVPANLAEGSGRGSNSDFRRFVFYALGSTSELEYDLFLAKDLCFLPVALHTRRAEQIAEVRRMLSGFARRLDSAR